ncbi:glycosyltransferase family 2 protein [Pseudoxanthomonas japonensis]|uniref:Glycosyl transferase family 2 n=1 Tax=Pseudoxanthomonas japonensis TaxID=69284 RepID=A0ABQ6ZH85_9GAMM|nr:glycosyltransferase family A protein [Pseudoxanthomonas japonensis]KAF1725213.1 glycosyl transferase family 2 [Pseudoxanthomonas japonensis]
MTTYAVIITNYNYQSFVVEAIESVLRQNRAANQIIVIDDGSTDASRQVLQDKFGADSRINLIFSENGGQLTAFQRGMSLVASTITCFLDADDRWGPDYLEQIARVYDQRPDVGFIFSDIILFGNEQAHLRFAPHMVDLGYTAVSTYALTYWYGAPTSALSMRSAVATWALSLPEELARIWRLSADNCLVYGASLQGARKCYVPTGQVEYRIHGKNGWWSQRGDTEVYHNRLRSRGLIGHYARVAGLDDSCLELAKLEYKTKPAPDWSETRRYMEVCWRDRTSIFKKVERSLSIVKLYFRAKQRAKR